jgi:hypothetical protein
MGLGSIIGWAATGESGAVISSAASAAGHLAEAWGARERRLVDENKVNKETARDIVVSGYQADLARGLALDTLNAAQMQADRGSWRTSWIRPAFCALAFVYVGGAVLQHTMPGVAAMLGIVVTTLPFPLDWIVPGIPVAVLGLRPLEKSGRNNLIAAAATQAQLAPPAPRKPMLRITAGRDDRAGA